MERGETWMTSGKFCFARSGWRVGAVMALCLLQQAPGHVQLLPPQNVTLLSKDFAMILTWAPGEGSPPDVTYTVRYESQDRLDKWMKVPDCKNIPRPFCNLTCVLPNLYVKVRARVKALWGRSQSPWVKSQFKDYYSDVELAPPTLSLSIRDDSIHIRASFPLPTCVENLTWKYDLTLWEAGSEHKKIYEGYFRRETVTINTTALRGNYCFSARALYESISLKHSEFSQPVCVLLNHRAVDWKFPVLAVILLSVLSISVGSPFICCLVKHEAKQRKMPQVLDFSQFKAAGPTLHLELSEKELCIDELKCTERAVPQRRTNRALGGHLPWMASFPSSSSLSEEEEDEEEEDSSNFIPYHKTPKRHLSCQAAPAALGESSLGSGSGSVHRGSVLDLRALGFPLLAQRQAQVDSSGSQEETALYLCPSLGRISLTDVRFPGASEQGLMETEIHGNLDGGNREERLGMSPLQPLLGGICAEPQHHLHRKAPHLSRDHQRSIRDHQKSIMDHHKPIRDHQKSIMDHHKPIRDHQKSIMDHHKPIRDHQKPIMDYQKSIRDHQKPIRDHQKPIMDHHKPIRDHQKSFMDLQLHLGSTSQPREEPSRPLLIPLWSLQLAEDEGIASDCDSDSLTEGTPPEPTVLSDAFETSNTEEKYHPKVQFSGYEHSHYLGRI